MSGSILDVVIVGSGYAGLCASYYLKHFGLEHMVFDAGKIGQSWRATHWDSQTLHTPNKLNLLPGSRDRNKEPEGFSTVDTFLASLEYYAAAYQLPIAEQAKVLSIEKDEASLYFNVTVAQENEPPRVYSCWQVLVATGTHGEQKIPSLSQRLSPDLLQLHTNDYRTPAQLPEGAVLVVGSGQAGCQITEELLGAGRDVYLSTSPARRVPRQYRGKDILEWMIACKLLDQEDAKGRSKSAFGEPVLTGVGDQPHTLSLQALGQAGAVLLGRLERVQEMNVFFQDNLSDHVKVADDYSAEVKKDIDEFVSRSRIVAPAGEIDEADVPGLRSPVDRIQSLDLRAENISTILWATGTYGRFDFLKLPVLDYQGQPHHVLGESYVEGLYFLGFPGLRNRRSNYLFGIKDDAGFVCNMIYTSVR
jgi:putative flavoprotein involved in K+ transport